MRLRPINEPGPNTYSYTRGKGEGSFLLSEGGVEVKAKKEAPTRVTSSFYLGTYLFHRSWLVELASDRIPLTCDTIDSMCPVKGINTLIKKGSPPAHY